MAKKKKVGSTGRFGPRYGVKVKGTIRDIEESKKKEHECPRCNHDQVRRESSGIWNCGRCGLTFAGGAYNPLLGKKIQRIVAEEE